MPIIKARDVIAGDAIEALGQAVVNAMFVSTDGSACAFHTDRGWFRYNADVRIEIAPRKPPQLDTELVNDSLIERDTKIAYLHYELTEIGAQLGALRDRAVKAIEATRSGRAAVGEDRT